MNKMVRLDIWTIVLLTTMLAGCVMSAYSGDKPTRVVTVKIVADRDFASQEVWQRKAALQVMDIVDDVRNLLGVELKISGFTEYRRGGTDDLYELASRMTDDVSTDGADVIIGFTYGPCPKSGDGVHADGITIPFRGMVIRNYYPPCDRSEFTPYAMIHEIVHLFGGVHVGRGSMMSPIMTGNIYLELDPINRAIVNLTRNIDFARGYSSLDSRSLEKLATLYRQAIGKSGGDLTVLTDLADVYRAQKRYALAQEVYRGILGADSANTGIWLRLAGCAFDDNEANSAFALLDTALAITRDSGQVYYKMARFYFTMGRYDRAYTYAAKAAWCGTAVDSAFIEDIKSHYMPGEK